MIPRRSVRARRLLVLAALVASALAGASATPAFAEECSGCTAWWHLASASAPTYLAPGKEAMIVVTATNLGDAAVKASPGEPVTISDVLPAGLVLTGANPSVCSPEAVPGQHMCGKRSPHHEGNHLLTCEPGTVSCKLTENLAPYEQIEMDLNVKVEEPLGTTVKLPNTVKVEGGGARPVAVTRPMTVNGEPTPFAIENYEVDSESGTGEPETQAGAHPFQLTTTVALNESLASFPERGVLPTTPELTKNVHINLPPGLIGNPIKIPRCTELEWTTHPSGEINLCPPETAIGVAVVRVNEPQNVDVITAVEPVFNLVPSKGEPARFGFQAFNVPVTLDAVDRSGDYHVVINVNNASDAASLLSSEVTVWGVPADPRHDQSRGFACLAEGAAAHGKKCEHPAVPSAAFLSLPTSCTGAMRTNVEVQSWLPGASFLGPASPVFTGEKEGTEETTGCAAVPFEAAMTVQPTQHESNTPTGLVVDLKVPQKSTEEENGLAEANLRNTIVKLPEGVQLSPSAANGLASCGKAEIGYTGHPNPITKTEEFTPEAPTCPDASKIGTVRIKTPVLEHDLTGSVYLAKQEENPFGSLFGIYIVVEGDHAEGSPPSILVKLAGEVKLDPTTGQITTNFPNAPQLPFEELELKLNSGPRASIATPRACGTPPGTQIALAPWSGQPALESTLNPAEFNITSGPEGTGCANPQPFSPALQAGSTNNQAGAFTPFTLTITRPGTDQALRATSVTLPPGLAGVVKNVEQCPDEQANAGTCGPNSLIGSAKAVAGLGPDPFTVEGGKVYFTGPYTPPGSSKAPFGLSIVLPTKAGPFDFGNVVTRAAITIDPNTTAITITSTLPTMVNTLTHNTGVPVQLRRVDVKIERPGNAPFQFNPSNCSPMAITGTLTGDQGAQAHVSTPFQVANCNTLPFSPTLTAETNSTVTKIEGTSLFVKVTSAAGQANIAKTKIVFPEELPSRLTTIQKACPEAVFARNPATCPEGSNIGSAVAHTPLLNGPLTGPAYLVSHGGAAFPDAEFVLQGEGITLILDGQTNIHNGITSSTFNAVPDAPVETFEVSLPRGPHSAFTGHGDLCHPTKVVTKRVRVAKRVGRRVIHVLKNVTVTVADPLVMPTILTGQNGNVIEKTTPLKVSGCKAVKSFKAKKHKSKKKKSKKKKK
jgi:hypothetical protein